MNGIIKLNKVDASIIDYVNRHYKNTNPPTTIEIKNTKGISSNLIALLDNSIQIKIVGGYTEDLLKNRWYNDNFKKATTYSKNELYHIVKRMEEIEKGILPSWSQIQKTAYIFDKIKSYIVYDKDYKEKDRNNTVQGDIEMRSLRALISRKSVCAGYATVLKEMLDRQGIENEYVLGGTVGHPGNHAWVLAKINGRKFPLDVTWDAARYRNGNRNASYDNFANIHGFLEAHIPDMGNETMDYERELSGLSRDFVGRLTAPLLRDENSAITTFDYAKRNGNRVLIAQIGEKVVNGQKVYEYAYSEKTYGRGYSSPLIVCSTENLAEFEKETEKGVTPEEETKKQAYINDLFSIDNIRDSFSRGSNYIGALNKTSFGSYYVYKAPYNMNLNRERTQRFTRNDGSGFALKSNGLYYIAGKTLNSYEYCEFVPDIDGKITFQKNILFSEDNLFNDTRNELVNSFLDRDRIKKIAKQNGGYLGTFTERGTCVYDENVKNALKLKRSNWIKDDIERYPKYQKTTKTFTRSDGTSFTLTKMHRNPREIGKEHIVQYRYEEKVPKKGGGTITRRKMIFAQPDLENCLKDQSVIDYQFSRDKMSDENLLKTGRYIGIWNPTKKDFDINLNVAKFFMKNKGIDLTDKEYAEKIRRIYRKDSKTVKRSDGTSFKLKEIAPEKEITIYGKRMHQYEYREDIKIAPWIRQRKIHTLYSEEDLLKEKRQDVIDYLLSQKRIEKQCRDSGGYLGYYDSKGKRNVIEKRASYFRTRHPNFSSYSDVYTVNDSGQDKEDMER